MVVEHDLHVLGGLHFNPGCVFTRRGTLGIHIHDFTVALVFEKQALRAVSDHLIVRRRVRRGQLCLPVVVAQVSGPRQQFFPIVRADQFESETCG